MCTSSLGSPTVRRAQGYSDVALGALRLEACPVVVRHIVSKVLAAVLRALPHALLLVLLYRLRIHDSFADANLVDEKVVCVQRDHPASPGLDIQVRYPAILSLSAMVLSTILVTSRKH